MKIMTQKIQCLFGLMVAFLALLCPVATQAASFDCGKASTKVEKMICGDAELSKLDEELGRAYSETLKTAHDADALKQQQLEWLKERNKCMNVERMKHAYTTRLSVLTLPEGSNSTNEATNPTRNGTAAYDFKLSEDTGWTVCHDMITNLNKVQPTMASFLCEVRFDPSMKQFSCPEWEELNIEDYWQEVYAIEANIRRSIKLPPFEVWKEQYIKDMQAGYADREGYQGKVERYIFHPRLRRTHVRFESGGNLETVLAYARERNGCELFKELFTKCSTVEELSLTAISERRICEEEWARKKGGKVGSVGDHIMLYDPETRQVRFLVPGDVSALVSSSNSSQLFLHHGRGYLLLIYPGAGISIVRVERFAPTNPAIEPRDWAKPICFIPKIDPRRQNK